MRRARLSRRFFWLAIAACPFLSSRAVRAQTDEIQVYTGDLESPGKFNLTLHVNYTPDGRTTATIPGGVVPQGAANGAFEWAYGVNSWFEAGAYIPVYTITRNGNALLDGAKLRALFAVPDAGTRRFFYGVNFELSRNSRVWDQSRYGGEIRPIVGVRSGEWDFIANPILDTSFNGFSRLEIAPAARVAYNGSRVWAGAVEYYGDFGEVRNITAGENTVFAVADRAGRFLDVEAGIGFGLTHDSDKVVLKTILSHTF
ncbi:MAG TPA: hypothetical protein VHT23_08740 [Gemmatimonadaceae bacterium]|nr:hypothetical protein [Gemmatimonadaceae bacterium]